MCQHKEVIIHQGPLVCAQCGRYLSVYDTIKGTDHLYLEEFYEKHAKVGQEKPRDLEVWLEEYFDDKSR